MKFKFLGNTDCPEWFIAEVIVLNNLSSVKLKMLSKEVAKCVLGEGKEFREVVQKIEESAVEGVDAEILVNVLRFILVNGSKWDVEGIILNNELQQLGVPLQNSEAIVKIFKVTR